MCITSDHKWIGIVYIYIDYNKSTQFIYFIILVYKFIYFNQNNLNVYNEENVFHNMYVLTFPGKVGWGQGGGHNQCFSIYFPI